MTEAMASLPDIPKQPSASSNPDTCVFEDRPAAPAHRHLASLRQRAPSSHNPIIPEAIS